MLEFPAEIQIEALDKTHEDYHADYWRKLRAFYEGGNTLLNDAEIMADVFPRHLNERGHIYHERKRRAVYVNYCGEILDHIVASLMGKSVTVEGKEKVTDEFYSEFFEDALFSGGRRVSINSLIHQQVLTALLYRRSWTLVDLPGGIPELGALSTEKDQREAGALRAYAMPVDPFCVLDWERSIDGDLFWAKLCFESSPKDFTTAEPIIVRDYYIYTPANWVRYQIRYSRDKKPQQKQMVSKIGEGSHTFGRVPLLDLELPPGLWAMNKLETLAREHFNKRSALSWAEYKTLLPVLYEFLDGEATIENEGAQADPNRGVNQMHGVGYKQLRDANDRAEYISPSAEPFDSALKSLDNLRDEMHRITHQLALSIDNSASSVRRSGDSKQQDKAAASVVLNALGTIAREHVYDIYKTVSAGRGDDIQWVLGGLDRYDDLDLGVALSEAQMVKEVDIPSPTFREHYIHTLAKSLLRDRVPSEVVETVREELREAYEKEEAITRTMQFEQFVNPGRSTAPEFNNGKAQNTPKPKGMSKNGSQGTKQ